MKTFKSVFTLILIFVFTTNILAQTEKRENIITDKSDYSESPYWIDMMKDLSVNFYDIQEAFNIYFKDKLKGKGTGWKQFKRWEYFTEQRVYPSGNRIKHDQVWNEIMKFNKAYPQNNDHLKSEWTPLGPATSQNVTGHWNPGIGRINVIALDPFDADIIYIGAPSGGLWKTIDEGANWEVLTDHLPVLGVSAIAVHPVNTDIIYIGTGDKDASDTYSIGVLKSIDGGINWDLTGLDWTINQNRTISKLLINPDNPDILFASTTNGLYKTIDAGVSWYNVLGGDIDDIEFKPGDPTVVYANTQSFYRSVDGGENFTYISDVPGTSRSQIAVSNAAPTNVYFFSYQSGIYRSTDNGVTFTKTSNEPNQGSQGWYDLAFAVSHTNPEEVHLGEINTWKSSDGAQTWEKTTDWTWGNPLGYTHCDIHEMVFYGNTLYVGSDGLISKSTDGASTWTNLTEGISIRQFYRIGGSKLNPYKILGGSQDNGTSVFTEDHWHEWRGADGMECVVDYTDDNIVYGTSQFGNFYKSIAGGNNGNVSITQPGGGAWITPFVIHPSDHNTLFVGNSEVRKTTDGMNSWTTISNFNVGNLNTMYISESDPDYLYVSKSSTIYRTTNGGASWDNISAGLPGYYITYIAVHPNDSEKIAVSFSGYYDNHKVYISDDGGDSWINYSANLPNIPANCVIFNDDENAGIYVGMDVGVYYRDNTLDEWEPFNQELPNVIVNELEIQFEAGKIRAGTYGRGLWEADLHPVVPVDIIVSYTVNSGDDDIIEYGETAYLDVKLKNNMDVDAEDVNMSVSIDDVFINITDNNESFGTIAAGDSVIINAAFSFDVMSNIPNNHAVDLVTYIASNTDSWDGEINLTAFSPVLEAGTIIINDNDDGLLDPGESAEIDLTIDNNGGSAANELYLTVTTTDAYAEIENPTSTIDLLNPGSSDNISFDIIVDQAAPIGHEIEITIDISGSNAYSTTISIGLFVGLLSEDFETGDFTKFPWEHSGSSNWQIVNDPVYEGVSSSQSGNIDDSQESVLSVELNISSDGDISFFKKVSCENDPGGTSYDFLAFMIDDIVKGTWDGEIDWSREIYSVSPGVHSFKWVYSKDGYVSEGSDCAWIDYIVFPPIDIESGISEPQLNQKMSVRIYPNPFNNVTNFLFNTNSKDIVSIDIFNFTGQKVKTLFYNPGFEKGEHLIQWKGRDDNNNLLPAGIYFYKLYTGKQYTGSIVLMR